MRKETRTEIVKKDVYIAKDGLEFTSMLDCEDHEYELNQTEKEKKVAHLLYSNANNFDWASMCNPYGSKHEYKWFRINSDEDLLLFCEAYKAYCRTLKDIENVKRYVNYPDYICLVDYPEGPEDPAWFTLSKLLEQTDMFMSQFEFDEKGYLM